MAKKNFQFTLGTVRQSDEEFRRNIRAMNKEIRKTEWRPRYKPGMPVLDFYGDEGLIDRLGPGVPNGYFVVILKAKHHKAGTIVFWPEVNIKAHKKSILSVPKG